MISGSQKRLFALLHQGKVKSRNQRLTLLSWMTCRDELTSTNELSEAELKMCAEILEKWKAEGTLEQQCIQYGL